MDQNLLRSYFGTVYELPSDAGLLRVSLEGDAVKDASTLPPLLRQDFAILTAYNPRSMLLPRRVNDGRHQVLRDLLILGCHRVEHCVGYDDEPEGVWREPAWLVQGIVARRSDPVRPHFSAKHHRFRQECAAGADCYRPDVRRRREDVSRSLARASVA